jgi:hypothetical protein
MTAVPPPGAGGRAMCASPAERLPGHPTVKRVLCNGGDPWCSE